MTQRSDTSHAPKSPSEELGLDCAVPVAFVKIRSKIMTFEIGEDVLNHERLPIRHHQRRKSATIVHGVDQCGRSGKHAIENPVYRVVDSVYVGHTAIVIDRKILDVARCAAKLIEHLQTILCPDVLVRASRFETVEKVEVVGVDRLHLGSVHRSIRIASNGSERDALRDKWKTDGLTLLFCAGDSLATNRTQVRGHFIG